ncbi:hypothetical protein THII_1415 [Thioploca ingrica]|uniref:Uncharacterized protein n=1 Tax=Thioploca ingrica TaxID=40754 RepID=A0A090AJK4_9GAMM|nr:hypothetical protein THII_1415 [Thioploca ingrica]
MRQQSLLKAFILISLTTVPLGGIHAEESIFTLPEGEYSATANPFDCSNVTLTPDSAWKGCNIGPVGQTNRFAIVTEQPGCLRITDAFIPGDTFKVTKVENGNTLTTVPFAGRPLPSPGDAINQICQNSWQNSTYHGLEAGLVAGNHTIDITLTQLAVSAISTGYCVRFDTETPACRPLNDNLVSMPSTIVTNTGANREDVYFPNGTVAAENVAPGVIVVLPAQ